MVPGTCCVMDGHACTEPANNEIMVLGTENLGLRYDPEAKEWKVRYCEDGEGGQICSTYQHFDCDLEGGAKCVILTEIASHCQLACERSPNAASILSVLCISRKPH
jgi:hypothetical protein